VTKAKSISKLPISKRVKAQRISIKIRRAFNFLIVQTTAKPSWLCTELPTAVIGTLLT
jgi:hypothetical protein